MNGLLIGSEPESVIFKIWSSLEVYSRLFDTGELQVLLSPSHIPQSSSIAVPKQSPAQSWLRLLPSHIPQSSIKLVSKSGLKQYGSGSILLSVQSCPGSSQKAWESPWCR